MPGAKSVLIVGGGIVGLATAWRLLEKFPSAEVTLLEKEQIVGAHQSTRNSGVLHAGLYYQPGSTKAALAVRGIRQMVAFCREEKISHQICGKLVIATREEELPRLDELLRRGEANGLKGLRKLDPAGIRKMEPHAAGLAAAHVPEEGIVDYRQVCDRLAARVQERGGRIATGSAAVKFERTSGGWRVRTADSEFEAGFLITCAGLYSDRLAARAGESVDIRIVPFRGEYYRLTGESSGLVRNLIYPVPDPQFPFLGVHFTRMVHGGVEAGPNAVLAFAREGYSFWKINPADLADALLFPGLWRFLRKYPRLVRRELAQSLSKERFCASLRKLVPEIRARDLEPGGAGVRAQALAPSGELVHDFQIVSGQNALHVLNAPSPAATACLAIGEYIVERVPF